MLPANPVVPPLPSISSIMSDSSQCSRTNEYYPYDQYYGSAPLINIAYQAPTIYINQWQGFPPPAYAMQPQYSLSPSYPVMGTGMETTSQPLQHMNTPLSNDNMSSPSLYCLDDLERSIGGSGNNMQNIQKTHIEKKKRLAKHGRSDGICSHCSTSTTTLWRKNERGALECNACNLYFRRNQVMRPLTLCKDKPSTRNRRKLKKENPTQPSP